MNPDLQKLQQQIEEQNKMINDMYQSVEKLRKYFKWTLIITLIVVVLPMILLVFAVPSFLNSYLGPINSLTNSGF